MFQLDLRPKAREDTADGFDYYEEINPGLGFRFLNEVENFLETLKKNPHAYSYLEEPARQGKINSFPYVVIFEIADDTVIIFRVFNTHQYPDKKSFATKL
jgi:plasmid stabilization system protein ParE